jgi:hypothetical protein
MFFIELQHEAELPEIKSMVNNQKLRRVHPETNHAYKILYIYCWYTTGSRSVTFTVQIM